MLEINAKDHQMKSEGREKWQKSKIMIVLS